MDRLIKPLRFCIIALVLLSLGSCVDESKDLYDSNFKTENPFEEIVVPEGFDWKTTNSMYISTRANDQYNGQYDYLIEIFDDNPFINKDANCFSAGFTNNTKALKSLVTVPKGLQKLYVRQTTPTGLAVVKSVTVDGRDIVCDFSASGVTNAARTKWVETRSNSIEVPEIGNEWFPTSAPAGTPALPSSWVNTPGDFTISGDVQSISINNSALSNIYVIDDASYAYVNNQNRHFYILPGKTFTLTGNAAFGSANILFSIGEGAKLVINGKLSATSSTRIYNKGTVEIIGTDESIVSGTTEIHNLPGSSLIVNAKLQLALTAKFYNQGTITAEDEFHIVGTSTFYNNYIMNVKGLLYPDANSTTTNDGEINCGRYEKTSSGSSIITNNGTVTVAGETLFSGGNGTWINNGTWITNTMTTESKEDKFRNSCKLIVYDILSFNEARFINDAGSYIKTNDMELVNTRIEMGNASFINATGTTFMKGSRSLENEGIYGTGTGERALVRMVKVEFDVADSQHIYYAGNLMVACDGGHPSAGTQWDEDGNILMTDTDNINIEITESNCNPGWKPNPGGGNPVPKPVVNGPYTYLFEDQWPLYGDYDMNDVVIKISNLTYTPDANNLTDKFSFDFEISAVGAEKRMAAALMLDQIPASTVKSVSYSNYAPTTYNVTNTGIEQDQVNAVIPLADQVHAFMGKPNAWFINTKKESPDNVNTVPSMTVTVEFNTPVNPDYINVEVLNYFIIRDINQRSVKNNNRWEIHMLNYHPTNKVDTSTFGAGNDDSNSSSGKYYISEDNLCWAFYVPGTFRWPLEYTKIQFAYNNFENWITTPDTNEYDSWWVTPSDSGKVY